ncbi:MAG TPA: hypothetical protein VGF59_14705 [Bryobacteraceae bacterium]
MAKEHGEGEDRKDAAVPRATSNVCPAFVDPLGRYASLDAWLKYRQPT